MPTPGFIGNGFYTSKLFFGGVTDSVASPSVILNDPINLSVNYRVRDLTVNSLFNVYQITSDFSCHKIFCSGTLTLNAGGWISADADLLHGGPNPTQDGSYGFGMAGGVGGSGAGGSGQLLTGSAGAPDTTISPFQPVFLGGPGGNGGTHGSHPGGVGGSTRGLDTINDNFEASIYEHACLWINPAIYSANPTTFTNWAGHYAPGYAMAPICGGGGGGGCADVGSSNTGGGGAGGGVVYVAANRIVLNGGGITANGQRAAAGNGGGGGGGGVIVLVTNELMFVPGAGSIIKVDGGDGGGLGASDGGKGTILVFSDQLVGQFSTTQLTESVYKQALVNFHKQG